MPQQRPQPIWTFALFFASGAVSLIYEVLWTRVAGLSLGADAVSVATCLAAFMGGLGLGARLGSVLTARLRPWTALGAYGAAEALLAAIALGVPTALRVAREVAPGLDLALAGLVVALPALLMGATYPLVCAAAQPVTPAAARRRAGGHSAALLYAANTAGALVGTLLAAHLLLPSFGIRAANRAAAMASLAIGALALLAAWRFAHRPRRQPGPASVSPDAAQPDHPRPILSERAAKPRAGPRAPVPLLLAAALAGFAGLALEVAFTRALSMVMGGTVYAFAAMLAAFLLGIALGSAALAWRLGRRPGRAPLGWTLLALLLALAGTLAGGHLLPELPWAFIRLFRAVGASPLLEAALAASVLLAPALGLGAAFTGLLALAGGREAPAPPEPSGSREPPESSEASDLPEPSGPRDAARPPRPSGQREPRASVAGRLYAWNTLGSVLGALAAGLYLVPWLGIAGTLSLACGALSFAGAFAAGARLQSLALAAAVGAIAWLPGVRPVLLPSRLATGAFGYVAGLAKTVDRDAFEAQFRPGRIELVYHRAGRTSTVTVERMPHANTVYLKTNGKAEGSVPIDPSKPSRADLPTEVTLAAAPLSIGPPAGNALVIGLGSGVTLGAALAFPLGSCDVVEIERRVVEAVRQTPELRRGSRDALLDPRVHIHVEDARRFLLRQAGSSSDEGYDAIISQPSDPWRTGVANLFTREMFEAGREALAEDGRFAQWVQLYGLDRKGLRTLVATFAQVFPHVAALRPMGAQELVLLGSREPLRLDPGAAGLALSQPRVRGLLREAGLWPPNRVLGQWVADDAAVRAFANGAPVSTDDRNAIEFLAPRTRFCDPATWTRLLLELARSGDGPGAVFSEIGAGTRRAVAEGALAVGNLETAIRHARAVPFGETPDKETARLWRAIGDAAIRARKPGTASLAWTEGLVRDPEDAALLGRVLALRKRMRAGR